MMRARLGILAVVVALLAILAPSAGAVPLDRLGGADREWGKGADAGGDGPATRIVGGGFSSVAKYPWQVGIVVETDEGDFFCGGSLIHPLIVLTAAHCVADDSGEFLPGIEATLVLGRTTLSQPGGELIGAFDFWVHSGYNPEANLPAPSSNDVAFITLDAASPQPRILVAGADERPLWTPGREAFVSGWGNTSEGGSQSDTLKEALVPIIDDATCGSPGVYGAAFAASVMVCAGYLGGGTDSCQGDSGGPLQSPADGGGFRLTGIVSWGIGCAQPNRPGVYTRIASEPLLGTIRDGIPFIEAAEEFPAQYRGVNVIGSGARPPGCSASEAALAGAGAAAVTATTTLNTRQGALTKARKALRKAKKARAKAKRALRKAKRVRPAGKRRAVTRKARKRAKKTARRLKQTSRRYKVAKRRRAAAASARAGANAALAASEAQKIATCGV